jgi:hypothetical protein
VRYRFVNAMLLNEIQKQRQMGAQRRNFRGIHGNARPAQRLPLGACIPQPPELQLFV